MRARWTPLPILAGLALLLAALLTMWLVAHLPGYYGLLPLVPWVPVWCWAEVAKARRARRRQAERVTQSDPARWRWN
jgi:hypothetical protein